MGPVLYLDIDDTVLSWADGRPRPVPGSAEFIRWAVSRFEVRWLTRRCPSGQMPDDLLADLCKMVRIEPGDLRHVQGWNWDYSHTKVDGIAWLEHVVFGRQFAWVENRDGLSDRDIEVLEQAGFAHCYLDCNVTRDETALARVRRHLERRFGVATPVREARTQVA